MVFILYLIGFLIAFSATLYIFKKDSGKVLVQDFVVALAFGLCSWISILYCAMIWLYLYLEETDFWNKKIF